jgi:hypothetical protein
VVEVKNCRACGTDVPTNAPSGHCPECLLKLGFGAAPANSVEPNDDSAPSVQPIPTAAVVPLRAVRRASASTDTPYLRILRKHVRE